MVAVTGARWGKGHQNRSQAGGIGASGARIGVASVWVGTIGVVVAGTGSTRKAGGLGRKTENV